MAYAMYLRKSRADIEAEALGEGETLARHKSMLFKLAEKLDILPEQITIYHEIVSGDSISERPEMQRLLSDVYQKKYAGVLVVEVERLARGNTKDQGEVSEAFQYSDTKIITPVKIYDPKNEFDQEYFEFGLFMSRREYKTIKRRMEAGRMESVAEGNYVGSMRPYGYDIVRETKKDRILVEKSDESQYVKMIFDWFTIDRLSTGEIARQLTRMHIPTMMGNSEWNRGSIKDILQNIHYTGKVRWNRRRVSREFNTETGKLSKTKRRLTPAEYKVFPGKHKGFIESKQFELAQTLFTGQVPVKANETLANPFAGLLVCSKCGRSIRYNSYNIRAGTSPRYIHPESATCTLKSLAADVVNTSVIAGFKSIIADYEIELSNEANGQKAARQAEAVAALESELEKQERKRVRLFDAFEEGVYSNSEFIERKQAVNAVVEEIKKQIQETKAALPEPVDYAKKIIELHELIKCLQSPDASAREKNAFMKQIVSAIKYDVEDLGRHRGGRPVIEIELI